MKNFKEWFSVKELIDKNLPNLPSSDKGIVKKADREGWEKRQRAGVKGKTFEYYVGDMPAEVQQALGIDLADKLKNNISISPRGECIDRYIESVKQDLDLIKNLWHDRYMSVSKQAISEEEFELIRNYRECQSEMQFAIKVLAKTMALKNNVDV
ncbi:DNA-binding protein [Rodentibacter myodis]|uniref:HTH Mu-type domain-containing protein n=1 Tax=Rodentibacter myodis TaxID=1907939 RepID=A0A1V3JQ50_9PAST|nr:DNA-binding protein [Rodentibacter myodis]OOF58778.1 hypothetical protein BKL49_06440 [Rodentibacter myodis]